MTLVPTELVERDAHALFFPHGVGHMLGLGVRDASGASGKLAAHQIEARVRHWIVPGRLQVDTGAAVLIKRGLLRDASNAPATGNTRYGYVDVLLTL